MKIKLFIIEFGFCNPLQFYHNELRKVISMREVKVTLSVEEAIEEDELSSFSYKQKKDVPSIEDMIER